MFNILYATEKDIPLIRELTFKIWPQTYSAILSQEQIGYMLKMMYSEASLLKQMGEGAQFIILNDETEPVGFASFQQMQNKIYKLHKIYMLSSQQGKGAGKYLVNYIISSIKKEGATALQLQVNRSNKAKGFYEKLGFSVIEETDFDIGNGYFMNDYVMEKNI